MSEEKMVYVAADPKQPGAAWAGFADIPGHNDEKAEEIGQWLRDGATVLRVPAADARDMMMRWQMPAPTGHESLEVRGQQRIDGL